MFETSALTGLRGLAAIHLVLFHSIGNCSYNFNIYGQVSTSLDTSYILQVLTLSTN
jgi:hypothetical protein